MGTFSEETFSMGRVLRGVISVGHFLWNGYFYRERFQRWITFLTYLAYIESSVKARSYPSSSKI